MATTNKNFKVKNGLEVAGEIGVGSTPSYGTTGQLLTSGGSGNAAAWVDQTSIATSTVKHLVKNDSGVTLAKGTVVYTKSANGSNILVDKAIATTDQFSSQVLGFLETELAPNASGYCINNGLITGINTNGTTAGDPVWLSGTTAGAFVAGIANKPVAPYHLVYLGVISRVNTNNGEIFVHISNGWELDELHNVAIDGTPADNEVLAYDSASTLWKNQTASEAGLAELSGATFTGNVAGTNISLSGNVNATTVNATTFIGNTNAATITGTVADGTTTTAARGVGYMGLPQSNAATTGSYGVVAADAGEHIYTTGNRTVTIPANSNVAFPIGSTLVFINGNATLTIAITSDTMNLSVIGTTGSRTLAPYGMATAIKVASTTWIISGNGLT